ncbi:hypothetical protein KCU93_g8694, partial [Aureobasidium melanogenum]
MTLDPDLSDSKKALFVASMQQKGLPIGVPEQYVNEQLYRHANAVQDDHDVNFQSDSGDYFGYLSNYLANIAELDDGENTANKAQTDYLSARKAVDREYQSLRQSFDQEKLRNPGYKWLDHARSPHAQAYRDAWEQRDQLASELPTRDIAHLLQITDSAQSRLEARVAQNMPAIQRDRDLAEMSQPIDVKDIIYRPLHYLSGFTSDATFWRKQYNTDIWNPSIMVLNLQAAATRPWAALGFPALDDTTQDLDHAVLAHLDDWQVHLSYTHMATYPVYRGLWDVPNFRTLLPKLRKGAPGHLNKRVHRTTALLFAYGVQLKVRIPNPKRIPRNLVDKVMDGISFDHVLSSDAVSEFRTPEPENDAYPLLLAALTQKV